MRVQAHTEVAATGPAMVWQRIRAGEDGSPFAAIVQPAFKTNLVPTYESRPNLTHLPAFSLPRERLSTQASRFGA